MITKLKWSFFFIIDFLYKINTVLMQTKQVQMKKILLLLSLILLSSCFKEDDWISFSWNVGIYHNTANNSKHLSIELFLDEGVIDLVDFTTIWVFKNGKETKTISLKDSEFDYEIFQKTGLKGKTKSPLNCILDDYDWTLKEVSINGRIKVSSLWYEIDSRKTF